MTSHELVRDSIVRTRVPWFSPSHYGTADNLYQVASHAQWHEDDLAWSTARPLTDQALDLTEADLRAEARSPLAGRHAWPAYRRAMQSWSISQLAYGEQGALVVTGRLVEVLPDTTSKCLAAVQVMDEARHVRVMQRYLDAIEHRFDPAPEMEALIGGILEAPSWDYLFLGMQVVLEGLALSIFRSAGTLFHDPLLTEICTRISRDEARHYSFGVVSLKDHLAELTSLERRDREEYVGEAVRLMAERFRFDGIWPELGIPVTVGRHYAETEPDLVMLRRVAFRPVISALRRIDMWDGLESTFERLHLVVS